MKIPFTQYLMPDGRQSIVTIDRPPEVEALAQQLIAMGLRFECEMLSDYSTCSFTVFDPGLGYDIACRLAANGPLVLVAVDELIADAARLRGLI